MCLQIWALFQWKARFLNILKAHQAGTSHTDTMKYEAFWVG